MKAEPEKFDKLHIYAMFGSDGVFGPVSQTFSPEHYFTWVISERFFNIIHGLGDRYSHYHMDVLNKLSIHFSNNQKSGK